MQIHEDRQVQHVAGNGLQGPTGNRCFKHSGYAKYTESEIAECLRASGGDLGGAARTLLSVIGFDQHNLVVTGSVSMTLLNARSDGHSVPVVFAKEKQ